MQKIFQIINLKTLIVSVLAVISTYASIRFGITADFPLTLIATAIVFPIVFSINTAYKRREAALGHYGSIKSHSTAIFFATRDWLENPSAELIDQMRSLLGSLLNSCKVLFSSRCQRFKR